MADRDQFEGFEPDAGARPESCLVCEAMLPESVDGGLGEAEQRAFDQHVAGCAECARELAEARRGAAWLSMLKTEAPEPPVGMLERIMAGTTGLTRESGVVASPVIAAPVWSAIPPMQDEPVHEWGARILVGASHVPEAGHSPKRANVLGGATGSLPAWALSSVWRKVIAPFRVGDARALMQPRLAMTAAMAFFSIALTLNLTGVRLRDLRAEDFTPAGLQRTVADASASATRSFQNMRVVYQVESRVSELQSDEAPGSGQRSSDNGQGSRDNSQEPAGPSR